MTDDIKQPSHYGNSWKVGDFIRDQELGFHLGNAVKYISRAGKKPYDGLSLQQAYIKDLKKAITYLENELHHASLSYEEPERSSNRIPFSVWDSEQCGQPDYATGFDR
jgi:hypothetical protein